MAPFVLLLLLVIPAAHLGAEPIGPPQAAVASAHPSATEAGLAILERGGNAFDATVAVGAVLAVAEPSGSGLGGGGFWLLHRGADGFEAMLDGRERAPLAAHRDLYLDAQGKVVPGLSLDGPMAAGIPGVPAGLVRLAEGYGRLPLSASLAPAIALAKDGVAVDPVYRALATRRLAALRDSPAAAAQFLIDGEVPPLGTLVRQPDLAATLEALARGGGVPGFYGGPVAQRLLAGVRAGGGIWSAEDLAQYRVVERAPIIGRYRGWRLVGAAPPSSGGVMLVAMLNMLEALDAPTLTGAILNSAVGKPGIHRNRLMRKAASQLRSS
jgi:gamma-glutamyltranspeptidase/glutathione hydrolase